METDVVATNSSRDAIANLTAVAYAAERYLSEERFSNWLTSVDCDGDVIKLKFKNRRSFNAVKRDWKWVNDGKRRIIIVLSSGTCNNVARQPYLTKHVSFRGLTVTVEAQASTWAMPSHEVNFVSTLWGLCSRTIPCKSVWLQLKSRSTLVHRSVEKPLQQTDQ